MSKLATARSKRSLELAGFRVEFTLREAQLFRLLTGLFGEDRVIPGMSLAAVLGGHELQAQERQWASGQRCLFTILKPGDDPVVVIDFPAIDGVDIDPTRVGMHGQGRELLEREGIHFFVIDDNDLEAIVTPGTGYSLTQYLAEQFAARGIGMEYLLDE